MLLTQAATFPNAFEKLHTCIHVYRMQKKSWNKYARLHTIQSLSVLVFSYITTHIIEELHAEEEAPCVLLCLLVSRHLVAEGLGSQSYGGPESIVVGGVGSTGRGDKVSETAVSNQTCRRHYSLILGVVNSECVYFNKQGIGN